MNQCLKVDVVDCPISFVLLLIEGGLVHVQGGWGLSIHDVRPYAMWVTLAQKSWLSLPVSGCYTFWKKHTVTDTSMWRYLTFQTPSYITTTQTVMADLRLNLETKINIAPCETTPYCSGRVVYPCDPGNCVFWDEKPPVGSFKAKWHQGVGKQRNWGTLLETGLEGQLAGEHLLAQSEEGLDSLLFQSCPRWEALGGCGDTHKPPVERQCVGILCNEWGLLPCSTADYSAF